MSETHVGPGEAKNSEMVDRIDLGMRLRKSRDILVYHRKRWRPISQFRVQRYRTLRVGGGA